jgi:hypothetical protein
MNEVSLIGPVYYILGYFHTLAVLVLLLLADRLSLRYVSLTMSILLFEKGIYIL